MIAYNQRMRGYYDGPCPSSNLPQEEKDRLATEAIEDDKKKYSSWDDIEID